MDTRRVCDVSPADLIEVALDRAGLGWHAGRWEITLGVEHGHLLRARYPVLVAEGRIVWATVGRGQLANIESEAA